MKKCDNFPYRPSLINKEIFLRQKDSFTKFQNITKRTADATLAYFLCGFVGHFKIKYMFCVKAYKKSLTQEGGVGIWFKIDQYKSVSISKTKSIKIYKNIWKLHFVSIHCQTVCFKELLNQQKIRVKVKYKWKIEDDALRCNIHYSILSCMRNYSLTRQDRQC